MFLVPRNVGKFLRHFAPAIWAFYPGVCALLAVVAGTILAVWQSIFPVHFAENVPIGTGAVASYASVALFTSSGILSRRKPFIIDSVVRKPVRNYMTLVAWKTFLLMFAAPAFASAGFGLRYCAAALSFSCITSYRAEAIYFFLIITIISFVPCALVAACVYLGLQAFGDSNIAVSILAGILVNVATLVWQLRASGPLTKIFWISLGTSFLHLPCLAMSIMLLCELAFDWELTAFHPYLYIFPVLTLIFGIPLILLSDRVSAHPGSPFSSGLWRCI